MKEAINLAKALIRKKVLAIIAGALGLTSGIVIAVLVLISVIIFAVIGGTSGGGGGDYDQNFGMGNLSPHVLAYHDTVAKYAKEEGVEEHVPVILAIMQQESGGSPSATDPMQSSESLCGHIGCITNPDHSIRQGVKHFKNVLTKADGDLYLAIHSYNFGSGFINYVQNKKGKYTFNKKVGDKETYDLAISFSQEQYQKQIGLGNGNLFTCIRAEAKPYKACYGDILYVWSVMQYLAPQGSGEWLHPVQGVKRMTSDFRTADRPDHNGIDFSCNREHLPILAVDDGVVVVSEFGVYGAGYGGYGNVVVIKHSNNLYSLYGHLHQRNAKVGDTVKRGQKLGTCGNTGASQGIHLHLEARTSQMGGHFDPKPLLNSTKK